MLLEQLQVFHVNQVVSSLNLYGRMLACTKRGFISTIEWDDSCQRFKRGSEMKNEWNVNDSGHTFFCEVDASEEYHLYGG